MRESHQNAHDAIVDLGKASCLTKGEEEPEAVENLDIEDYRD